MTYDETNAFLAQSGLSIEGFMAFKARKRGESPDAPAAKKTSKEWLDGKKDCAHCVRDGACRKQDTGYGYDTISYMIDGHLVSYEENGLHNTRRPTGYQKCCIWSGGMMSALDAELSKLIKKGEIADELV